MNKTTFLIILSLAMLVYVHSVSASVLNATQFAGNFSDLNTTDQLTQTFFGAGNASITNNCTTLTAYSSWVPLTGNATKFRVISGLVANVTGAVAMNVSFDGGVTYIRNVTLGVNYDVPSVLPANTQTFGYRIRLADAGGAVCVNVTVPAFQFGQNISFNTTLTSPFIVQNSNAERLLQWVNASVPGGSGRTYSLNDTTRRNIFNIHTTTGQMNGSINVSNAGTYHIRVYATVGETTNSSDYTYILNNTAYRGAYSNLTPGGEQPLGAVLTCDVGGTDDDLNSIAYTWYRWYGNDAVVGTTSGRTYNANTANEIVNCEGILWDGNLNSTGVNSSDVRISGSGGGGSGGGGGGASVQTTPKPKPVTKPVAPTPSRPSAPSAPTQGNQAVVNVVNTFIDMLKGDATFDDVINAIKKVFGG